jgi:hypothetical protein
MSTSSNGVSEKSDHAIHSRLRRRAVLVSLAFLSPWGAGCRSTPAPSTQVDSMAQTIRLVASDAGGCPNADTTDAGYCPPIGAPWPYDTTSAAPPVYVLDMLDLDREGAASPYPYLDSYLSVARSDGWRRVFVASAETGSPNAYDQLWQLDASYPGVHGSPPPIAFRGYVDLVEHLTNFARVLLQPMPYYDPNVALSSYVGRPLLIDHAVVKDGAMARFSCLKQNFFKPFVEQHFGWKLLFAGHDLTGPQSAIVNVWALPDEDSLANAMLCVGHNASYQGELLPCIIEEHQNLYHLMTTND